MSRNAGFLRLGIVFPLMLMVLTTIYFAASFQIHAQFTPEGEMGPQHIPMLVSALMYIALFTVLIQELRTPLCDRRDRQTRKHAPPVARGARHSGLHLALPASWLRALDGAFRRDTLHRIPLRNQTPATFCVLRLGRRRGVLRLIRWHLPRPPSNPDRRLI